MRSKRWIAFCASVAWLLLTWLGAVRATSADPVGDDVLWVTVARQGVEVHSARPASLLHDVSPGDILNFRIAGEPPQWAQLSGFEAGAWVTYFHGTLRSGQPAPTATVMQRGRVSLKLRLCESSAQNACHERRYLL